MADIDLIVDLHLPPLPDWPVFSRLAFAVHEVATKIHRQWLAYAQGAPLPGGGKITPRSGGYLKSISLTPKGDLRWEVASNAPYAAAIEYGTAEYDLKQILSTSAKVRRTKDGRRYLIIPFRHGTGTGSGQGITFGANVLSTAEYTLARKVLRSAPSHVTGVGQRPSGNYPHRMVPQLQYHWGGRLTRQRLKQEGFEESRVKRLQGMVRFDKPAGGGHSHYLTFRTMIEGSSGWVRPTQPGRFPLKAAVDQYRVAAEHIFQEAVRQDVAAMMNGES